MARLTYGALALALASLVAGFFVRTTAIPLFASIGLSALVLILILRGWARRMRQTEFGEEEAEVRDIEEAERAEVDIEVLEDVSSGEIVVVEPGAERPARRPRPRPAVTEVLEERPERVRPQRAPRAKAALRSGSGRVVVLPGRTRYHTPACRFARGKGAEEISEATARRRHFQPCSVCLGG